MTIPTRSPEALNLISELQARHDTLLPTERVFELALLSTRNQLGQAIAAIPIMSNNDRVPAIAHVVNQFDGKGEFDTLFDSLVSQDLIGDCPHIPNKVIEALSENDINLLTLRRIAAKAGDFEVAVHVGEHLMLERDAAIEALLAPFVEGNRDALFGTLGRGILYDGGIGRSQFETKVSEAEDPIAFIRARLQNTDLKFSDFKVLAMQVGGDDFTLSQLLDSCSQRDAAIETLVDGVLNRNGQDVASLRSILMDHMALKKPAHSSPRIMTSAPGQLAIPETPALATRFLGWFRGLLTRRRG